jgi:pantoate--beta-alanine ligase
VRVVRTIAELRSWRRTLDGDVGLVPTMGFLHEGHLSLVRAARGENALALVSIFVNPTQFGPSEDLHRYPRDEARDLRLLESEGVDTVFAPSVDEMFPAGYATYIDPGPLAGRLEGASRPGHFRGVATVVLKLLNVAQPHRAYFGQKDAQQLTVIRHVVRDLNVPVAIVGMPIVREPDGLALSSRNVYLSSAERGAALVLSRALAEARDAFAAGERNAERIRATMRARIDAEALARCDYVSVADAATLDELDVIGAPALASLAVFIGSTRLIDNATFTP